MPRPNDLSRSLVALHQDSTLIAVIELSQSAAATQGRLVRGQLSDTKFHHLDGRRPGKHCSGFSTGLLLLQS